MFRGLQTAIRSQIVNTVFKVGMLQPSSSVKREEPVKDSRLIFRSAKEELERDMAVGAVNNPTPKKQQVGRNDPCPCGSGKKYKKCGGLNTEEHKMMMAKK